MTRVSDLMAFGALTVNADEHLNDIVGKLRRIGHEGYPVLDDEGHVVGLLTARDMNRAAENGLEHLTVQDVMMAGDIHVSPETPLSELLELMVETGWGQIPVMKHDVLVGIITRTDVIKHYATLQAHTEQTISHVEVQHVFGEPAADLIAFVARHAAEQDKTIYIVGGIVRDLLLQRPNYDIDFVLEGNAIAFVQSLQAAYGGDITQHEAFGTAKWKLDEKAAQHIGHDLAALPKEIDLVTARHEFYQQPAVLPTVYNSGIRLDLRRRDFTINALAVQLNKDDASGTVIDLFGGVDDLQTGTVRVLHSLSFADDPTRIFRAVRYAHRLDFEIEPRTLELIDTALPMLKRITGERVRNEITRMFAEPDPAGTILHLQSLGVLQAVSPAFVMEEQILQRVFEEAIPLDMIEERALLPDSPEEHGDFGWLLMATSMDAEYVGQITERLLFNRSTAEAMKAAAALTEYPSNYFTGSDSAITLRLERLPLDAVLAAWVALPVHRPTIEHFVLDWRHVRIATDGHTLKQMGLRPGPQFKTILEKLRAARIDGIVQTDADEAMHLRTIIESE